MSASAPAAPNGAPICVPRALARQLRDDALAAGFRPVARTGRLSLQLAPRGSGQPPLVISGAHLGPEHRLDLGELDHALIRLLAQAEHALPRLSGGSELFGSLADVWRSGRAPAWRDGRLGVHRGGRCGLEFVTWQDDRGGQRLLNVHLATERSRAWAALPPTLRSVVPVLERGRLVGSGVTVGPGLVLTALHVVGTRRREWLSAGSGRPVRQVVTVPLSCFGAQRLAATAACRLGQALSGLDHSTVDLALLVVPGLDAPAAPIRASRVPTGEHLVVAGYPQRSFTATFGPVAAADEAHVLARVITGPGASGGPALDAQGAVAGILSIGHPGSGELLIAPGLLTAFLRAAEEVITAAGQWTPAPRAAAGTPGSGLHPRAVRRPAAR